MRILKEAVAGSLESCDCLVMVKPFDSLKVEIDSIVMERYGRRIREVVEEVIREMGVDKGYFKVQDRGALDYCLRARVKSAIRRAAIKC